MSVAPPPAHRRLLVIGASSGIGRATAVLAARAGGRVVLVGRRSANLEAAAAEALDQGGEAIVIAADVRDPAACADVVGAAVKELGGIDCLVYAAARLEPAFVADADCWRTALETNVMGAALVTGHALPHLREARGRAVYLSSDSVLRPRPGVLAYVVSKAALDALVEGLREEEPTVEFSRVLVGPTHGTDIASGWDPVARERLKARWAAGGWDDLRRMTVDECAAEVLHIANSPVHIADVLVQPRADSRGEPASGTQRVGAAR
jgi:NAD(P)-dependent dehydrogenase (short-subunit alcohol dehydrogenase family)